MRAEKAAAMARMPRTTFTRSRCSIGVQLYFAARSPTMSRLVFSGCAISRCANTDGAISSRRRLAAGAVGAGGRMMVAACSWATRREGVGTGSGRVGTRTVGERVVGAGSVLDAWATASSSVISTKKSSAELSSDDDDNTKSSACHIIVGYSPTI